MSEVENKRVPRPLKSTDIFLLVSIISKIGVRNLMHCFTVEDGIEFIESCNEKNVEKLGKLVFFGVLDVVMERLEYCENSICKLLASLYGMTEAEIKEMGATEYLNMLIDVVKDENFVDFFKQAYESVKRML